MSPGTDHDQAWRLALPLRTFSASRCMRGMNGGAKGHNGFYGFLRDGLSSLNRRHGTDCHDSRMRAPFFVDSLPVVDTFTAICIPILLSHLLGSLFPQNETEVSRLVKYGSIWHSIGVTWRGSFILFTARLYLDSHVYTRMSSCLMLWLFMIFFFSCFSCDALSAMISTTTLLLSIPVPFSLQVLDCNKKFVFFSSVCVQIACSWCLTSLESS